MADFEVAWKELTNIIKYLQCKKIILEGDSLIVITWINAPTYSAASGPLLQDIYYIVSSLNYFRVPHVPREANFVIDWLADNDIIYEFHAESIFP